MEYISYKQGYKYQLVEDYVVEIKIVPKKAITIGYLEFHKSINKLGNLTIRAGYAWDGPSGPTIDTANFMRGSLVHDALYQLMRESLLNRELYREPADRLLKSMCIEDGMSRIRAWLVYRGVRVGGSGAANPRNKKKVKTVPCI